ncbi:hypothetical protein LTR84_011172 [Exophiala bonariae]|uniref:Elongin-A n=1 Tax=Exophiala bonariae TaxID=1690606 RepID=A0AAV9NM39_9EURO|nr:hypothetical protein LTR84_011172 [Exophiala bonariae]
MAQTVGADSLVDMARRACTRFGARITDIGDLRYELIRPMLLRVESPEKLYQLEQNSPQIIGRDGEIWLSFIRRDIPDWEQKRHEPKDPKNWYKVYRKLKKEAEENAIADEAVLKAALANINNEKEQNVAQMSTRTILHQEPGRRARIYHNYVSGKTGSKGASKMTLMEKIRKEARDSRSSKMNKPMHELKKRSTTVARPPMQFVEDLKKRPTPIPQMSPPRKVQPRAPRPPMHGRRPIEPPTGAPYDLTVDREARLRALKNGTLNPTESKGDKASGDLTADFLEDSDDDAPQKGKPSSGLLNVLNDLDRPRSASPMKLTPQPLTLKRKQPPSLFVAAPKRVARKPGIF